MKTALFVFSGTGNSLWVAQKIAERLEGCELLPLQHAQNIDLQTFDACGLIFPVHMWGPPSLVKEFVRKMPKNLAKYLFSVAVNAGQVAYTLGLVDREFLAKNNKMCSGFSVKMVSSYIPWGGAPASEIQDKINEAALEKIESIVSVIKSQKSLPFERGPLWQRLLLTGLAYKLSTPHIPKMAKSFHATIKCNACGICSKVCPTSNIFYTKEGNPSWNQQCTQCFACLQWCPQGAIEFGKNTAGKIRYHHKDILLKHFIDFNK